MTAVRVGVIAANALTTEYECVGVDQHEFTVRCIHCDQLFHVPNQPEPPTLELAALLRHLQYCMGVL